jgi:large subunit ribosomal protein L33
MHFSVLVHIKILFLIKKKSLQLVTIRYNSRNMADSKKKQTKVYLIPESESRDSHTYHYLAVKTKKLVIENQKLRIKKFNPVKRVHEWFVEAKLPPHSK